MKDKEKEKERGKSGVINPFIDWSFKFLFGREETKDLLIGFLNELLMPENPIADITYLNNERLPERPDMRECVFDVICKDNLGNRFLVEMQYVEKTNIRERLLYYACRLINEMGQRGEDWNYELDRVYAICLMDFIYEKDPVLRSNYLLRDIRDGRIFSDRLNVITLQVPCIQARSLEECKESYENLLFLLVTMKEGMKTIEDILTDIEAETCSEEVKAMLRRVAQTADKASLSPEDRVAYDYALKRYRDYYAGMKTAEEKGYDRGKEEGQEEGRKNTQREIAKAMKDQGMALSVIEEITKLSPEEIETL